MECLNIDNSNNISRESVFLQSMFDLSELSLNLLTNKIQVFFILYSTMFTAIEFTTLKSSTFFNIYTVECVSAKYHTVLFFKSKNISDFDSLKEFYVNCDSTLLKDYTDLKKIYLSDMTSPDIARKIKFLSSLFSNSEFINEEENISLSSFSNNCSKLVEINIHAPAFPQPELDVLLTPYEEFIKTQNSQSPDAFFGSSSNFLCDLIGNYTSTQYVIIEFSKWAEIMSEYLKEFYIPSSKLSILHEAKNKDEEYHLRFYSTDVYKFIFDDNCSFNIALVALSQHISDNNYDGNVYVFPDTNSVDGHDFNILKVLSEFLEDIGTSYAPSTFIIFLNTPNGGVAMYMIFITSDSFIKFISYDFRRGPSISRTLSHLFTRTYPNRTCTYHSIIGPSMSNPHTKYSTIITYSVCIYMLDNYASDGIFNFEFPELLETPTTNDLDILYLAVRKDVLANMLKFSQSLYGNS